MAILPKARILFGMQITRKEAAAYSSLTCCNRRFLNSPYLFLLASQSFNFCRENFYMIVD